MLSLDIPSFAVWLDARHTPNASPPYDHVLLKERAGGRDAVAAELKLVFSAAMEDARNQLRRMAGHTLDPLGGGLAVDDPATGYPQVLALSVLQGYTGEILAGICAEHLPCGCNPRWKVPALIFRFHADAFRRLPYFSGNHDDFRPVPGRTGDDCLAFQRTAAGEITGVLVCEAKCLTAHRAKELKDVHSKAALDRLRSFDVLLLADILKDDGSEEAAGWRTALQALSRSGAEARIRTDQVMYVCGNTPVRTTSWSSATARHICYTATRSLRCFELHISEVESFVRHLFDSTEVEPEGAT